MVDPTQVPVIVHTNSKGQVEGEIVVHQHAPARVITLAGIRANQRFGFFHPTRFEYRTVGDGTVYFDETKSA